MVLAALGVQACTQVGPDSPYLYLSGALLALEAGSARS
jgi:hypothetical protein